MASYSSREAARKLGISPAVLSKYLKSKKLPAPKTLTIGRLKVQAWTEAEVERARKLLPKIANGRKTRYKRKQQAEDSTRQPIREKAKPKRQKPKMKKKPPPRAAVPHVQRHHQE